MKNKMEYYVITLILICAQSTIQTNKRNANIRFEDGDEKLDNRRIWGYVLPTESKHKQEWKTADNPCDSYTPTKPDFTAPWRRISQIKCYEYIWEIKKRADITKRIEECYKYQASLGFSIHFVTGGYDAGPEEYPHMGAIGWAAATGNWVFKCGSTLISSKFVLTAAHCTRASDLDSTITDPVPKIVRLGHTNIMEWFLYQFTDAKIVSIIVHPRYSSPKKYYDIALMELENEITFSVHIQPACLWTNPLSNSLPAQATVTGWGALQEVSGAISPRLQAGVVNVIDSQTCDSLLLRSRNRNWWGLEDHQLCGGKLTGDVDTCQGDSGGPLQVKIPLPITSEGNMHYVIGVTSFGIGCGRPNLPGVYIRVSSFINWIEAIVWSNSRQ